MLDAVVRNVSIQACSQVRHETKRSLCPFPLSVDHVLEGLVPNTFVFVGCFVAEPVEPPEQLLLAIAILDHSLHGIGNPYPISGVDVQRGQVDHVGHCDRMD